VAGELMAGLLQNLLEAVARLLQATLQGPGTDVEFAGDFLHFGTTTGKFFLDGGTDTLGEGFLALMPLQFLIELRREDRQ
jgi:hypothetical protein